MRAALLLAGGLAAAAPALAGETPEVPGGGAAEAPVPAAEADALTDAIAEELDTLDTIAPPEDGMPELDGPIDGPIDGPGLDMPAIDDPELALPDDSEAIPGSYVVLRDPEVTNADLARAWAILEPDFSRAREGSTVVEVRFDPALDPALVLQLLEATKGVRRAEANFALPLIPGEDAAAE